jgi:hypothetical protein
MNEDDCYVGMMVRIVRVGRNSPDYKNTYTPYMSYYVGNKETYRVLSVSEYGVELSGSILGWDWSWLEPVDGIELFLHKNTGKYSRVKGG